MRIHHYALIPFLLLCGSADAEIYKYVNNGITTYSEEKPVKGSFENLKPSCLLSYIGCEMAHSDWSRIKLNHITYKDLIVKISHKYAVEPALIRAVVHAESNFNHKAVSRAGAEGLMQLMPETQKKFSVRDPFNVWENLDGGTRLMQLLMKKYNNNIKHAAAAYNAGEGAVAKYRGVPPYEETQNYVARVEQLYSRYRGSLEWSQN